MKKSASQQQTDQKQKQCPHIKKLLLPLTTTTTHKQSNTTIIKLQYFSFIKPQIKGWICLNDGCVKKVGTLQQIKEQVSRYEPYHKIFMEMGRLEVFCFQCGLELTDNMEKGLKDIRKLAIEQDKQQEKTLFGSNIEYPLGFQKQKVGLSGTIGTEINSYINSVIQLLAHTPPFFQISEQTDLSTIRDQCFKQTLICINKIRSGVYRIVQTKQVQKQLIKKDQAFLKYGHKTALNFLFLTLRAFLEEFYYFGPVCKFGKIIQPIDVNTNDQKIHRNQQEKQPKFKYSPMKQFFGGEFIWLTRCQHCQYQKQLKIQFQCLRLSHDSKLNHTSKLQQLIDQSFNLKKTFHTVFSKMLCSQTQCFKKKYQVELILDKSKIKLPNIFIFQFDGLEDGMSLQYGDVLDLGKYAVSYNNGVNNANNKNNGNNKNNNLNNSQYQQYKYQYVGSIAKNAHKRYYTHIRQLRENNNPKQYIFDDVIINENVPKPSKVVLAIYKLLPMTKNKNIAKNVQSSVLVDVECYVPLPDFWSLYISELRNVQPLVNPYICRHGYLAPMVKSKCKDRKKIPAAIYQYLVQQFGGSNIKIKKQDQYCPKCTENINLLTQLKNSQKQMAMFADQLSSKKSKVFVDVKWFEQWRKYLYQTKPGNYQNQQYPRPGPINNKKGIKQNQQIQQSCYKRVSPEVWYYFKKFYGGGPLISKNHVQPSLALMQAVDLRYERIRNTIQMLKNR